jgi:hypothetical protein
VAGGCFGSCADSRSSRDSGDLLLRLSANQPKRPFATAGCRTLTAALETAEAARLCCFGRRRGDRDSRISPKKLQRPALAAVVSHGKIPVTDRGLSQRISPDCGRNREHAEIFRDFPLPTQRPRRQQKQPLPYKPAIVRKFRVRRCKCQVATCNPPGPETSAAREIGDHPDESGSQWVAEGQCKLPSRSRRRETGSMHEIRVISERGLRSLGIAYVN